ncbi:hypothetical protein E2C01_031659 [Portunus trituberculatus]|uniref:Uncharacterized protein n=1 Tax=Portunus trituberculatus TaxID=210409 RepID=A0A5B7F0N6_PORTR|nr:hypothetical protein [Portunus trituberculatus]
MRHPSHSSLSKCYALHQYLGGWLAGFSDYLARVSGKCLVGLLSPSHPASFSAMTFLQHLSLPLLAVLVGSVGKGRREGQPYVMDPVRLAGLVNLFLIH